MFACIYVTLCCAQKLPHAEHEALIRALANKIHGRVSKADVLFELAQQIRKCALIYFVGNFKQRSFILMDAIITLDFM